MPSREAAHHVEHVADELRIERRGRLVEQHQLRLHRQRPGDRDTLLLAAGELRRVAPRACRQGRRARAAPWPPRSPGLGHAANQARRLDHVLECRLVREQVEALEDHPDVGAALRHQLVGKLVELVAALDITDELASTHSRPLLIFSRWLIARRKVDLPSPTADDAHHFHRGRPRVRSRTAPRGVRTLVNALGFEH